MPSSNKVSNVIRAVLAEPWLILESKLEEIAAFLEMRAEGIVLTEDEIQARFGNERTSSSEPTILEGGIQVINVEGTLSPRMNLMMRMSGGTSTMQLANELRAAGKNDAVKSVVLAIDSPGGAASYTPEAASAIRELAGQKRVVASATNSMASGAYWIGAAADEVYASPSTQVGSIGVYSIIPNYKEAAEKSGVKFAVLRAGDLKAAGNPYEELTSERLASLQKRVDDIYQQFVGSVAEFRKTTPSAVEKEFGQGSVFLAGEAAARKMIDGVATFEEVLARERDRTRVASRVSVVVREVTGMNPKLKAALFARGLIENIDADDATCSVALRSYRVAVGINDQQMNDDQLIQKLFTNGPVASELLPIVGELKAFTPDFVGKNQGAVDERLRVMELKSRAKILSIDESNVDAAISEGLSVEEALVDWTNKLAQTNRSVSVISPGEAEVDKIALGAGAAICKRLMVENDAEVEQAFAKYGKPFEHTRLIDLARVQIKSLGHTVKGDDYEDAKTYLSTATVFAADGSVNRRGDHPDMLSALTRKSLLKGATIAPTTYQNWCERIEDLPDFKPRSFIDTGVFKRLDAITEDDAAKQLKFESDLNNWIAVDRYANSVGLTVEMIVDDDLGGFSRQLRSLGLAARMTLQASVLDLLNSNPTMPDGNAFFSAAHANLVATGSGGIPSAAQLKTHRQKHRLAVSFGAGNMPMGATLSQILVPAALEEAALQTVAPVGSVILEQATKTTDTTLNTFRGKVNPIIDAHLDAYSAAVWYSMIPTEQASPIVYAFQSGFGAEGRREEWYDPSRKTRYISLETRFGVALAAWRSIVRNDGA